MLLVGGLVLCALSAAATSPVVADREYAGPEEPVTATSEVDPEALLRDASAARDRQEWSAVRALLGPLLVDDRLSRLRPYKRRAALLLLAEATLLDDTLPWTVRREAAARRIEALLDADPRWSPTVGVDDPALIDLHAEVHPQWLQRRADLCEHQLALCNADNPTRDTPAPDKTDAPTETAKIGPAPRRSRAVALLPFGIGHFYSGHRRLGAAFLIAEAATALTGAGLWAYRAHQCWGNGPNLVCVSDNPEGVIRRRQAEQALGIATLSLIAVDVVLAQILFRTEITEHPTERRSRRGARARVGTPTARPILGGAALGWNLRF